MPSAVTIAPATVADIGEVRRLADTIWRQHYPGILTTAQIDYMLGLGYSHEALAKFVTGNSAGLALAERDGNAVGFVAWYRIDGERATKLDKLYVLPQHHGCGIGRALIEHVVARARAASCDQVTLNVNRNNVAAVRAYERCGFEITGRGDFPIGSGFVMEDFIMTRAIDLR